MQILSPRPRSWTPQYSSIPRHQVRGNTPVPALTGSMDSLRSYKPVVVLDVENLTASAHKLGLEFDYAELRATFAAFRRRCQFHAVFSRTPLDDRWVSYFRTCGIEPHPRDVKQVRDSNGLRKTMNSDISLAVLVGVVVASKADEVVIATGDGELATEVSETVKHISPRTRIATLGVPGSISARLDAASNPFVDANMLVGRDCLVNDGTPHY